MSASDFRMLGSRPLHLELFGRSLRIIIPSTVATTAAAISVILGLGALYFAKSQSSTSKNGTVTLESDHPLLKDHSKTRSFTTKHATYPAIRTFYHPHAHTEKLQAIADLPLLVFIHGLGGSLPQFAPLLGSLSNVGPCFGIELPGHGMSSFWPREYGAYTIEAFAELWRVAIEDICKQHGHGSVVLVGHSMGCSIATMLATTSNLSVEIKGLVDLCPKATPPSPSETKTASRFLSLPDVVLNLLRTLDRRGGVNSKSVERMAGKAAGVDLRRTQLAFNKAFQTPVWKRAALGCLPRYLPSGQIFGGLPGEATWAEIKVPLFLIAGEADTVTKPGEVAKIVSFLQRPRTTQKANGASTGTPLPVAAPARRDEEDKPAPTADDRQSGVLPSTCEVSSHNAAIIKTAVLPAPAAHALMYDHSTYRTVAGLIEDFLARYVSPQLSLGWQLQQLTTSGKWDVKNLEKWKKVLPVSGVIGHPPAAPLGIFRALKTLREQDEVHTPAVFLRGWRDRIFAVVDISHDSPVYDTKALERGGVEYHKFPTVSKVPPTAVEVADFVALVDRLRSEPAHRDGGKAIGVHCHYGYNRTGFFIACYLIERLGYRPQDALEEFAQAKPPGIRHDHFIDTLFMRYHVGLKKAPTMLSPGPASQSIDS